MSSIGQEYLEGKDPVHEYEVRWWFWNELWSNRIGPYDSCSEADRALEIYIEQIL